MALSLDLRSRIVEAYKGGQGSQRTLAQRFRVGQSTVERLLKHERETGSIAPKPHGGGRKAIVTETHRKKIRQWLSDDSDLTQEQLAERFTTEMGKPIARSTFGHALRRLRISRKKKSMKPAQQSRADVAEERAEFMEWMATVDPNRVVVVDESGLIRGLRLAYGYAPKGERVYDTAPLNKGKRLNLVSWMRVDGSGVVATHAGRVNGPIFRGFVMKDLVPSLRAGDVVVWDNARIHGVEGLREMIEARGAELKPLPRYSPDLNPIEMMWSKVKHWVKKARADTLEALEEAVEAAVARVASSDAEGWYSYCGFCLHSN